MKNREIGYFLILLVIFILHPVAIAVNDSRNVSVAEKETNKTTQQGRRVALLIGNFTYSKLSSLTNPKNDVALMEATLRELGFNEIIGGTQRGMNLNSGDMHELLHEFGEKSINAEVAVIFFAGHGLMSKIGSEQYLAAINTTAREGRLEAEALSITAIMKKLSTHGAKKNFVFLDACRTTARGTGMRSITPSQDAPNTVILYATAANDFAEDGDGKNSPFTQALAAEIKQPHEWAVVQRNVIKRVLTETQERQEPKQYGGLREEMYFNINITVKPDPKIQESQYWDTVKDSKDIADFEAYLSDYPNGQFKRLAENKIKSLKLVVVTYEELRQQEAIKKRLDRGEYVLILSGGIRENGMSRLWVPGRKEPMEQQFDYAQVLIWTQAMMAEFEKVQRMGSIKEINKRQNIINPLLENLYKIIIGSQVKDFNIKKLTIILDGELHHELYHLPFSALRNEEGVYLGEQVAIHVASIDLIQYLEEKGQFIYSRRYVEERSLILGHDSEVERQGGEPIGEKADIEISKILPNPTLKIKNEATETFFKENARYAKYIYINARYLHDKTNQLNSFISLRRDEFNDGKLTIIDLNSMQLNSDILVLNACLTAQGFGNGGNNLIEAGFKAGSRYVMGTLWEIDDDATSMMMISFFKNYIFSKDNAEALKNAQDIVRKKYPHPYFWAGMQIYG